jgi:23S rRNA (guanosine2251-2'-O)-methyltransferase
VQLPIAVLVGNEGEGLAAETVAHCDMRVAIPMLGTATSLNVSVAAGVVLYEVRRKVSEASGIRTR